MKNWVKQGETEVRAKDGNKGGTMRLGSYECRLVEGTLAHKIYGKTDITERHRHRYEVNYAQYKDVIEASGIIISGTSIDGTLPEVIERHDHPFFIATQAHPEFKSSPLSPHPLFYSLIKAGLEAE